MRSEYFDKFFVLSFQLHFDKQKVTLSTFIEGEKTGESESGFTGEIKKIEKQVLGGTLDCKDFASFFVRELIIAKCHLNENDQKRISMYLWEECRRGIYGISTDS
jgi:hypothetical protein